MKALDALRGLAPDLDGAWNHAAGLLLPAALIGLAFVGEGGLLRLPPDARAVVGVLPLLIAVTGLALAWRFDRGRLLLALALVLMVFVVERALGFANDGHAVRLTWAMTCFAAPLALLALATTDDPGVLAPWRDPRALLFVAPPSLVAAMLLLDHDGLLRLLAAPLGPLAGLSPIPSLGLLAFAAAAVALVLRYARRPTMQRGALLGALGAIALLLHEPDRPELVTAIATAATLLLTFATLQESWSVAYVDPLTELPGRRALDELLRRLPARYALAMVDVDHFKRFNDTHGHQVGDEVLRLVASHLRGVGGGGLPHRYGGEEFTIVFPDADAESAWPHLEALREEIDAARFELRRGERRAGGPAPETPPEVLGITVSIGVADHRAAARPSAVIEAADSALYEAKRGGRNRCRAATPGVTPPP
jgi:diguanylate cyclase (GGDEF)-like protein